MPSPQLVPIGEICSIVGGGTPSRKNPDFFGGSIPWATVKDFKQSVISTTEEFITELAVASSATNVVPKGTVLLVSRVGLGKVAIAGTELAINQDIKALTPREDVMPEFLYWFLLSKAEHFVRIGVGATVKGITLDDIRSVLMPVPSKAEQQRIIDILSRAESIVRLRREAQQKAAELVPAIFLDMFGDPATNPKGLQTTRIENLCTLVRGSSPRPQGDPQFFGGPVPRLMIADITRDGVHVTPRIDSLTELGATKSRPMKAGEVVMAVSGAVGLPAILAVNACIHDGFVGFRDLDPSVSPEFFYSYLSVMRQRSASQAVGATFQNLKTDQVKEWLVPIPTPEQQRIFLDVVSRARSIHSQQGESTTKAETTFEALLHSQFER